MHLTYPNSDATKADVANVELSEIKITPEMIRAGGKVLATFSPREDSAEAREEILEAIYLAMELARRL